MTPSKTEAERFWERVEGVVGSDCWLWIGNTSETGYGRLRVGEKLERVHRWAYEHLVGPIPEGLTIDHLCRNRRCVNPDHLEPVTAAENTLRGEGPSALNALKTHCPVGHPLSGENLYLDPSSRRHCRACRRRRKRQARALAKERAA